MTQNGIVSWSITLILAVVCVATIGTASASASETCTTSWDGAPTVSSANDAVTFDYVPACSPSQFQSSTTLDYKGLDNQWHTAYNGSALPLIAVMPQNGCGTKTYYDGGGNPDVFVNWTGGSCGIGDGNADFTGVKPKNKAPSQGSGSLLPICQWPFRVHEDRWDGTVSNSPTAAATC